MTQVINDYQKQANDFAAAKNLFFTWETPVYGEMWGDGQNRYIFKCQLNRDRKQYTFNFGQSVAAGSNPPSIYDILACLTKYDPEDFENFCTNYGYDTDSRKAYKTYKAVVREWQAVNRLFGDCLDELRDIQ